MSLAANATSLIGSSKSSCSPPIAPSTHYLITRGIESLHRVHEKPDARKVLEFEELARAFGYSLGVSNLHQREMTVRHGNVPAPARAGRPDSYGKGRERQQRIALPPWKSTSPHNTIRA